MCCQIIKFSIRGCSKNQLHTSRVINMIWFLCWFVWRVYVSDMMTVAHSAWPDWEETTGGEQEDTGGDERVLPGRYLEPGGAIQWCGEWSEQTGVFAFRPFWCRGPFPNMSNVDNICRALQRVLRSGHANPLSVLHVLYCLSAWRVACFHFFFSGGDKVETSTQRVVWVCI